MNSKSDRHSRRHHWLMRSRVVLLAILLGAVAPGHAETGSDAWRTGGNIKYQLGATDYDPNNIMAMLGAGHALDQSMGLRLKTEGQRGKWSYTLHYDIGLVYGSTAALINSGALPSSGLGVPNDRTRYFNLAGALAANGHLVAAHRIDRMNIGYTGETWVFRVGRHALSFGGGTIFHPLDILNPFSPVTLDKEYKTGDDMLYAQQLLESGSDIQYVFVPRRDTATGALAANRASMAIKYRGNIMNKDVDLMLARHYGEVFIGLGIGEDIKGTVWQLDIATVDSTSNGLTSSCILSAKRSWEWGKHNVSGYFEYYRNGFGIANGDYSPLALAAHPGLSARLARGELYTLGRDYLGTGFMMELTPRWVMSPALIVNLNDLSGLMHMAFAFDWKQDANIGLGLMLPFGVPGSEYGGIPSAVLPGSSQGAGRALYIRIASYF